MTVTNYLLDTNALSEASKKVPNAGFVDWFTTTDDVVLFTSCLVLGEIKKGIALASDSAKQEKYTVILNEVIESLGDRIIGIDREVALLWGELTAYGQRGGLTPSAIDTLIAAQCIAHNLTLVTRNVEGFKQFTDLKIFSPWTD